VKTGRDNRDAISPTFGVHSDVHGRHIAEGDAPVPAAGARLIHTSNDEGPPDGRPFVIASG